MRKGLAGAVAALSAVVVLTGCSVSVREHANGVDVEVKPPNISIQTGAGSEPKTETASVELPAEARSLEFVFSHGVGELWIDGEGSSALSGEIGYWQEAPRIRTQLSGSRYLIEIPGEKRVTTVGGRAPRTDLHLGARIPTRLEVNAGVGEARIDLRRIPATDLNLKAGVGQVTVIVPESRHVRVRLTTGIGSHNLREAGFVKRGADWLSPDFQDENVLEIRMETGIGEFRLERW